MLQLALQELTPRAQDSLVSFGERLSTRVFAAFLRSQGIAANQHDAFSIGMTTTDDFQNAEVIYHETLPAIKAALTRPPGAPKSIPVVTGFLGRGINTGAALRVWCSGRAPSWPHPSCARGLLSVNTKSSVTMHCRLEQGQLLRVLILLDGNKVVVEGGADLLNGIGRPPHTKISCETKS